MIQYTIWGHAIDIGYAYLLLVKLNAIIRIGIKNLCKAGLYHLAGSPIVLSFICSKALML